MNRGYHTGWLASPIGFINSQEINTYLWIDQTKSAELDRNGLF